MTYHDDPNINRPANSGARGASDGNMTGWVVGGIAATALIAVGFYVFSGDSSQMAKDVERPVVTAPAATPPATTGSAPPPTRSGAATTGSGTPTPPVNR